MLQYGSFKRGPKLHGHDKCDICSEKKITKGSERLKAKKEIRNELNNYNNSSVFDCLD